MHLAVWTTGVLFPRRCGRCELVSALDAFHGGRRLPDARMRGWRLPGAQMRGKPLQGARMRGWRVPDERRGGWRVPDARMRAQPLPSALCLANIASNQKSLTLAFPVGTLQAMRSVIRPGAAVRSARATHRDLLLEILALRHQLGVLARSKRRFRPADRLFWLFLRWLWPRWREALVLIQPATVERWHREGVRRWWRRRSRRPGRPRIDSPCRDLIRRMAAENRLWALRGSTANY
jgi:hypothetical protein